MVTKKNLVSAFLFCIALFVSVTIVPKLYIIATTEPAYTYMRDDLAEQVACAQKAGLAVRPPILRVMKPAYVLGRPDGFAHMSLNIVTLAPYASYETIGHELGHILDWQTGRKGSPLLERIKDLPDQAFADAVRDIILHECSPAPGVK